MNEAEKLFLKRAVQNCNWSDADLLTLYKRFRREYNNGRLFASVRSVSRSGMSRVVDFYFLNQGTLYKLARTPIGRALPNYSVRDDGYRMHGCGTDMIFECLYNWWYEFGRPHKRGWKPDVCQNAPYNPYTKYRSL